MNAEPAPNGEYITTTIPDESKTIITGTLEAIIDAKMEQPTGGFFNKIEKVPSSKFKIKGSTKTYTVLFPLSISYEQGSAIVGQRVRYERKYNFFCEDASANYKLEVLEGKKKGQSFYKTILIS